MNEVGRSETKRKQEAEIKELKAPGLKGNSHVGCIFELPVYDCREEKKNYDTTITVNIGHMFIYFNNL